MNNRSSSVASFVIALLVGSLLSGCADLSLHRETSDALHVRYCRVTELPLHVGESWIIPMRIGLANYGTDIIAVSENYIVLWSWSSELEPDLHYVVGQDSKTTPKASYRLLFPTSYHEDTQPTNRIYDDGKVVFVRTQLVLDRHQDLSAWKTGVFELTIIGNVFDKTIKAFTLKKVFVGSDLFDTDQDDLKP